MTHQHSKPLRRHMNERRILKKNIRDYLTRVKTVKNSTALSLLHRARDALKDVEKQNASALSSMSLELHHKLEFIETSLHRLKKRTSIEIRLVSYATAIQKSFRFLFEIKNEAVSSFKTSIKTISQSSLNHRNIIIVIIKKSEKEKLKKMTNKNFLKIMQKTIKEMKDVIRLRSEDIRIQTELIAIKTILQANHD
jgi:diacylglycerol kinase family enzyme